jgi:DNA uptake protein ComE-like DNA-binding protein
MHIIQVTVFMTALFFSTNTIAQVGQNGKILDANLADIESLQSTLSIGAELAEAIDEGRPYLNAQQLDTVLLRFLTAEERRDVYSHIFRQINLNQASRSAIMLIPNMSERIAHEFEEYRPYSSLEQFRREMSKYVDAEEVARLEQYVFIPLNLNAASEAELMTIPGMTSRMAHEFEEYRPYVSYDQFRREIGKYVDDKELLRLESYVTLD